MEPEPKLVSGIPNLFALYPQLQDCISSITLLICMLLWMPYNIEQDKGFDFSLAMDIFWICDAFTIGGCVLTLMAICTKDKKIQLSAMFLLIVGVLACIIAGALDSDEWCHANFSSSNGYIDECVAYIVFMYCLFIPFCIFYVILLILYRLHYSFTNLIFMRSKRIIYLMFVSALMIIPVAIMIKWYFAQIDYEWRAYWISILCFDVFTWIIALIYGFTKNPRTQQNNLDESLNGDNADENDRSLKKMLNLYHPLCVGAITVLWVLCFVSTLLWGFIGYSGYDNDEDDLLARYADYILMVSVNLWIIGEVLSEDEGSIYFDIDRETQYSAVSTRGDDDDKSGVMSPKIRDDILL